MIKKLKLSDFYDVYGISLLVGKIDKNILLENLLPITKKYIDITYQACIDELKHFILDDDDRFEDPIDIWDGDDYKEAQEENKKLLTLMKDDFPYNLSFLQIAKLFNCGTWDSNYGGKKWGNIAKSCDKLKNSYERKNINHILMHIDHLNDLEHNNNLYLSTWFAGGIDFKENCIFKSKARETDIFNCCSLKIQQLRNKSQSLVALYH